MSKLLVIVILLIVLFNNFYCSHNSDLLSVIVIYRHGARAPKATYKNDPYKDTNWGADHGHLTNQGKIQLYELGKWLRNRYNKFLPAKYSSDDFKVVSSDKGRCMMSAAVCLAALYPPKGEQVWNKQLLWQPIPIRVIPDQDDAVLKQWRRCAKHDRLHRQAMKKDYVQNILKENQEFFKHLSEKSGEDITSLRQIKFLFNICKTQRFYNVTIPAWATEAYQKMKCLAILETTSYTSTTEMARLKCGPLIDIILSHFESITKNEKVPKFLMFSAHYTTLTNMMNTMKVLDYQWPDFASILIFELRKDSEKHFVNMLYKNSTGFFELSLSSCRFDCDINKYKQILAPVRLTLREWARECFE